MRTAALVTAVAGARNQALLGDPGTDARGKIVVRP
jgi:hypothetical protein